MVAPKLFGKFLFGNAYNERGASGYRSFRGIGRGAGRGAAVTVIGHVQGTGNRDRGGSASGSRSNFHQHGSNYTPLGSRFGGYKGYSHEDNSSKRSRAPDSAGTSTSSRKTRQIKRQKRGRTESEGSSSSSDCSGVSELRDRLIAVEGGLESVKVQAEIIDRNMRDKEFRVWNVPNKPGQDNADMLGMILMDGLGFTRDKTEEFFMKSVNVLRRPRIGKDMQFDTCILVGVNSIAARELIFGSKHKLGKWANPWGGKPISITPNYTKKQNEGNKGRNRVFYNLSRAGFSVERVQFDRISVDGGAAKHYSDFVDYQ